MSIQDSEFSFVFSESVFSKRNWSMQDCTESKPDLPYLPLKYSTSGFVNLTPAISNLLWLYHLYSVFLNHTLALSILLWLSQSLLWQSQSYSVYLNCTLSQSCGNASHTLAISTIFWLWNNTQLAQTPCNRGVQLSKVCCQALTELLEWAASGQVPQTTWARRDPVQLPVRRFTQPLHFKCAAHFYFTNIFNQLIRIFQFKTEPVFGDPPKKKTNYI